MAIGTVITCVKCGEHGGTLLKLGDAYVHQHCKDKEAGIERRKSPGRPVLCPKCGAVLLTRYRKGRLNVGTMNLKNDKAVLVCDCGYRKEIKNPFAVRNP